MDDWELIDPMTNFMTSYPYFVSNVVTLIVLLIILSAFYPREQQRLTILIGLLNMPFGILSLLFENQYWTPSRIGGWSVGIEDMLVSFLAATGVWMIAVFPHLNRIKMHISWKTLLKRYCLLGTIVTVAFVCLVSVGVHAMTALLIAHSVLIPFLILRSGHLWRLSLWGAFVWAPFYCLLVRFFFWIWPEFLGQWRLQGFWGQLIAGIPLGEVSWALMFGVAMPLVIGYYFDARIDNINSLNRL